LGAVVPNIHDAYFLKVDKSKINSK
jgi:hypothetical protein